MTIDERLEKLADRHESLAHAVELLAIEGRATSEKIDKLEKVVGDLGKSVGDLGKSLGDLIRFTGDLGRSVGDLGKFTNEIAVGTARLLSIAEFHENRITRLEGQL